MIYQTYQKQVEAWKERFLADYDMEIVDWNVENPDYEEILSSRHKDTIELLEAEIERKEKMVEYGGVLGKTKLWNERNKFIDEDIAYLEEQLKLIKKEI